MVLDRRLIKKWVEGAIYPSEMVFFLASCVASGVELIVESGRQDGHSTEVLGEFARQTGMPVKSIDIEFDRDRGERCRKRLAHLPVDMIVGDGFEEVGRLVMQTNKPLALLLDGPKLWGAISILSAAASWPCVRLLAMHNLDAGYTTRAFMEKEVGEPIFYEDIIADSANMPNWTELRQQETTHIIGIMGDRAQPVSGLGVIVVTTQNRARLSHFRHSYFRTYPPWFVRWAWKVHAFGLLKRVFSYTNRFMGPEKY